MWPAAAVANMFAAPLIVIIQQYINYIVIAASNTLHPLRQFKKCSGVNQTVKTTAVPAGLEMRSLPRLAICLDLRRVETYPLQCFK